MSAKHPIVAITGSSGAGTTSVMWTFQQIFRREGVKAAVIEGDSFHRFDRVEMRERMKEETAKGNDHFSHFGPDSNLFEELEETFRAYGATGTGRVARQYLLVPIDKIGNNLTLAMSNPLNVQAIEDVELLSGCSVQTFVSTSSDVKRAIEKYYKDKE